ncbi:MobF family relaxase [Actinoplanes aureus]|uniref:Relaxase domain-containing protein n=1 Tax=Actinoplanes aureus TaxID=2792083 RepID=A0A931G158_9ACTN|nr:MobF family relaxase [Actinoplanes aureus]MBG0567523.1 relaxase domain-containing protein [Actinoplanes aureus]
MLTVTRIAPGAGIAYLTRQVATGRHDFRPAEPHSVVAYHADPTAHGEAPGWWAGQSNALFGVRGEVTEQQLQRLLAEGKNPVTGEQLGRLWRQYQAMDDDARRAAVEKAWEKLPKGATYEQIARVWLNIWTAPERRPVAGFDVTVSPVKSVSLLWAFGDDIVKQQVMAAHHEGVRATLQHLRRHGAFTRLGTNGLVQVDTDGLAAAVFDHRMSREKDPQLHSHIIVSSKVRITRNGRQEWLSLDSRAFYQATIAARIAYERAVETELGRRLGVRFAAREGSPIREIIGITARQVAHYSKRRTAIDAEMQTRVTDLAVGRDRLDAGRWRRRAQDATLRTRPDKDGPESTVQAVARWRREDRTAGLGTIDAVQRVVAGVVTDDIDRAAWRVLAYARQRLDGPHLDVTALNGAAAALGIRDDRERSLIVDAAIRRVPHLAVERAVHDLSAERAVFTIDHLELAIGRILHVPTDTDRTADWKQVQQLAAHALRTHAAGLRILTPPALLEWGDTLVRGSDRQSIYSRHRDLKFSTQPVLAAEKELLAYATGRGATSAARLLLDQVAAELDLSDEKRAALHFAVGDDRRVTGIVGPAGTGKTYLQRAVGIAAHRANSPVLGLTVSQNAAYVLAAATREGGSAGIRTENIAMWLQAQHNPPDGTAAEDWAFQPGQWVIVDEASQASTLDLVRLTQLLAPVGGKLILVGDPEQISSVGPGGLFRYLASLGNTTALSEVRRFHEAWEGPASLRLREGDTTVLAEYDRRGRILGGDRRHLTELALNGWAADIIQGHSSLIMVETEAEAADIAAQARHILINAGIVAPGPAVALANGTKAGVGDLIVTRRNNRDLIAGEQFVANRDQWTVLAVTDHGGLQVQNTTTGARLVLPADYVAEHVQLAYAATVDSAQGRTVDVGRALVDSATTRARAYVMATRGRLLNWIGVVTSDEPPEGHPAEPPTAGITLLADILRADTTARSATETEQALWADVDALRHWGAIYDDLTARVAAPAYVAVIRAVAGPAVADNLAADPAMPALAARLQGLAAAGYDPAAVLAAVASERELTTARDTAAVLAWRIDNTHRDIRPDPVVAISAGQAGSYTDRISDAGGDIGTALTQVAAICDRRVSALADLAAQQRPTWSHALGPVPDDEPGHRQWLSAAAVVAAYRDRYAVTGDEPIGPEPSPRDPGRWGAWHRARLVLGIATVAGQVAAATDPQLRALVEAQRAADRAAPLYVSGDLRDAHTRLVAAEQHLRDTRLTLATAQTNASQAASRAGTPAPRWWHTPAVRARAAAEQQAAAVAALRATVVVDELHEQLDHARGRVTAAAHDVAVLEDRHRQWSTWYAQALPIRYAGLAAHTEALRRAANVAATAIRVAETVRQATDRVHAVDATRPNRHAEPVRDRLAHDAAAGYERVTDTADHEPQPAEHDLDLGRD